MDDRFGVERVWFNNTRLLGFNAAQNESKYGTSFSHDMFKNPNVKGMEVILHFLLSQLYPTRLNEVRTFPFYFLFYLVFPWRQNYFK